MNSLPPTPQASTCLFNPPKRRPNAAFVYTNDQKEIQRIEVKPLEGNPLLSLQKHRPSSSGPLVIRHWEKVLAAAALLPWIDAAQNQGRTENSYPESAALILSYPAGEVNNVEVYGTLTQAISAARSKKTSLNLDIIAHWGLCMQAALWVRSHAVA